MLAIRPARPEDKSFLLALTERLAAFPVPGWRTPAQIANADRQILLEALRTAHPDATILVAETAPGDRVGYVFATTREDYFLKTPQAHVEILAVEERAEGQGVAGALMRAFEEWARGRGCGAVTLNVFDTNQRARGLYEHLGFQPETVHYIKRL
ncbi:MAG: GNAT family N-acetyltransferase [Gemmatimonadales bacterium]